MKKFYILFLILIPLLFMGCTADNIEPGNVEAADSIPTERPTEAAEEIAPVSDILDGENSSFPPKYCPVTQPPEERFVPPAPYKEYPYAGQFWYGTEALWTAVPIDRTWHSLPYNEGRGYTQKVAFWREGYHWIEEPQPELTLNGRLITPDNSESLTFTEPRATNGFTPEDKSFMLVGVEIPTTGCWEITGQYGEDSLTFVIWVAP